MNQTHQIDEKDEIDQIDVLQDSPEIFPETGEKKS